MNTAVTALVAMVRSAGRWLIKRLVRHGHTKVLAFIELRIETFRDRLERARKKHRKRRLRRRIAWRVRLLSWLRVHEKTHTKTVLKLVDRQVDELGRKVPWDHAAERRRAA